MSDDCGPSYRLLDRPPVIMSGGFDPHPHELTWAVAREDWIKCNQCRKMVVTAVPFLHCTSCPTPEVLAGSRWDPWRAGYDVCGRCAAYGMARGADATNEVDADEVDTTNDDAT